MILGSVYSPRKAYIKNERPLKVLIASSGNFSTERLQGLLKKSLELVDLQLESTVEASLEALYAREFDIAFIGVDGIDNEWVELIAAGPHASPATAIFGIVDQNSIDKHAEILAVGALDCFQINDLTKAILTQAIRYGVSRKRFEEKLRESKDQLIRNLIDLRDAKERAEQRNEDYVNLAEQLSIAKENLENAFIKTEESERKYRALSDSSPVGIWQMDSQGQTLYMNNSLKSFLGVDEDYDIAKINLKSVMFESDIGRMMAALRDWSNGVSEEAELRIVQPNRKGYRYLVMTGVALNTADAQRTILVTAVDITDRKEAEAALQHVAHHDALTGLPNRSLFVDRIQLVLNEVARHGGFVAVLFLDLDHFKDVNDTLGHPVGDRLLMEVSARLLTCVRESDTVARLGGDEFAILCSSLSEPSHAAELAQRIVELIRLPYHIDGHEIHTATSIGVSIYPTDATDADRLISFADMALYKSKEKGRSTYHFFDQSMDASVQRRKTIENDLRESLQAERFILHFQPQLDLRANQVVGGEALVRWQHPLRGLISPNEFIPIAEQCGLILPLGQWIIRQSFLQAKLWHETLAAATRVSINLSAVQFRQKNMVGRIQEMVEETGVDPALIDFELTESMLVENIDEAVKAMDGLTNMGFHLTIDDFGTGFSSLAYLKKFPVNCLKIDRSFVADIMTDPDDRTIVRSIIQLAHNLELQVVAEGVESAEQADFLKREECDFVQGYLYGGPMTRDAFIAYLSEQQKSSA